MSGAKISTQGVVPAYQHRFTCDADKTEKHNATLVCVQCWAYFCERHREWHEESEHDLRRLAR